MPQKLFSVPRSDLNMEFFRAGGKGGQNVNKRDSACRITHIPSGAVGEARDERQQAQNRSTALKRMVDSKKFQAWVKLQAAMLAEGYANIERKLDAAMANENIKVELGVDCKRGEHVCDAPKTT